MEKVAAVLNKLKNQIVSNQKILMLIILSLLSIASFNVALEYTFWRDDWTVLYLIKYQFPNLYFEQMFGGRHPGEIINSIPWYYFYGLNSYLWQIHGVILKVIASVSVGLLSFTLAGNKKIAYVSAIIYSATFIGLEAYTWMSARLSAELIILISLQLYTYKNYLQTQSRKSLVYSLILIIIFFYIEPARAIFYLPLVIIWEMSYRWVNNTLFQKQVIWNTLTLITSAILTLSLSFIATLFSSKTAEKDFYIQSLLNSQDKIKNIFFTIGNIPGTFLFNTSEKAGLISYSRPYALLGVFITVTAAVIIVYSFHKKLKIFPAVLFSVMSIFAFYIPAWIADPQLTLGASHRYLALSTVGISVLMAIGLNLIKIRIALVILGLIVFRSIYISYSINSNNSQIRSAKTILPLYQAQLDTVGDKYSPSIFIVTGDNDIRGSDFDFTLAGTIPFAVLKGVKNIEEVPIQGNSIETIQNLLCEANSPRPYMHPSHRRYNQPNKVSLDRVFAWEILPYNSIKDVSNSTRNQLQQSTKCLL